MSLNYINNQPLNTNSHYSPKRGFRLSARDDKSDALEKTIKTCQASCPTESCKKICELSNKFFSLNDEKFKKCATKCGNDAKCGGSCYVEILGITQTQYDQNGKLSGAGSNCPVDDEKKYDECLAKALNVNSAAVKEAGDCVEKQCIRVSDFRDYLLCSLKCNKSLLEKAPEPSKSKSESSKETDTDDETSSKKGKSSKSGSSDEESSSAKPLTKFSMGTTLFVALLIISSL